MNSLLEVFRNKKNSARLNVAGFVILAVVAVFLPLATSTSVAQADEPGYLYIGMPFEGKWAYDAEVSPDENGNYNDATSSHPSVHATNYETGALWGDWAIDLYPTNTASEVKFNFTSNVVPTFTVESAATDCGNKVVITATMPDGKTAKVYFEHILDPVALTSANIVNGVVVGKTKNWGDCNSNAEHVHFEVQSGSSENRSCWYPFGVGKKISAATNIAKAGATGITVLRKKCDSETTVVSTSTDSRGSTSILVAGVLHSFYYDATNGNLRHAWTSPTGWNFESLDGDAGSVSHYSGDMGRSPAVTVVNGVIQLFYYDATNGNLRHAWTSPTGWNFESLDGDAGSVSHYDGDLGRDT